jgi:hypothetical protein
MSLLACTNLFGVVVRIAPRATMRFAPDSPKKLGGFNKPISCPGCLSGRYAVHVIKFQSSQKQLGNAVLAFFSDSSGRITAEYSMVRSQWPGSSCKFVSQGAGDDVLSAVASTWFEPIRPRCRSACRVASCTIARTRPAIAECSCLPVC